MRSFWTLLLVSGMSFCQAASPQAGSTGQASSAQPAAMPSQVGSSAAIPAPEPGKDSNVLTIPAGTKLPLSLKQAISTKNAREGDAVYAETAFPFVLDERVVVPPGTYIQGKIVHVERGGRLKGRAEILIHFTSMIYPTGYTVMLPG